MEPWCRPQKRLAQLDKQKQGGEMMFKNSVNESMKFRKKKRNRAGFEKEKKYCILRTLARKQAMNLPEAKTFSFFAIHFS